MVDIWLTAESKTLAVPLRTAVTTWPVVTFVYEEFVSRVVQNCGVEVSEYWDREPFTIW